MSGLLGVLSGASFSQKSLGGWVDGWMGGWHGVQVEVG